MKSSKWSVMLGFICSAAAYKFNDRIFDKRQSTSTEINYPEVAEYKIAVPIDHFSDTQPTTYDNRYFVNDTYYKPGGPVIFINSGESGLSPAAVAILISEFDGTQSVLMRLAEQLNGVAILWEHRYFGQSLPIAMDNITNAPASGIEGYKYLTIEQALEDMAFFANKFNTTTLDHNSVIQSTASLDPYHTPWIIYGASYPGSLAAWARQRNPEIFYASWVSSAFLEARYDGSIYWNPVSRAYPSNCTTDFRSTFAWFDKAIDEGNTQLIDILRDVAAQILPAAVIAKSVGSPITDQILAYALQAVLVGGTSEYQSRGPHATGQIACDAMQSFDLQAFDQATSQNFTAESVFSAIISNPGNMNPTEKGIVSMTNQNGLYGIIAILYGAYQTQRYQAQAYQTQTYQRTLPQGETSLTQLADSASWQWLVMNQMGGLQASNVSSRFNIGSKYNNLTAAYSEFKLTTWPTMASDIPQSPDFTGPLFYGGWDMQPSNTMFTDGEFDGWRAFGVHSEEQEDAGAPSRKSVTAPPECNVPPAGTDVFGTVYAGATHGEDVKHSTTGPTGSEEEIPPLDQGLRLFVPAYQGWQKCFEQSRDNIRNGKGVDGNGHSANGTEIANGNGSGKIGTNSAMLSLVVLVVTALCQI